MKRLAAWTAATLAGLALAESAWAGGKTNLSIGVSVGPPAYYRPYPYHYHYYRPWAPVYVAPAPVYYAPAPVVVQQPAYVQPAVIQPAAPAEPTLPAPTPLPANNNHARLTSLQPHLNNLRDPNEGVRIDSVTQLGRTRSEQAIDPLAATLSGDQSPVVREAAARALGVIGSARCLPALTRAAQQDNDRDVRRSAQFAVEIIQANH